MNLPYRIELLTRLGDYILSADKEWLHAKEKAGFENGWFIPEFVELAVKNIGNAFLQKKPLEKWVSDYPLLAIKEGRQFQQKEVGIVMAGNIPLVGFHDLISVFVSGHKAIMKPSSKDQVLVKQLVKKMAEWEKETGQLLQFREMLNGCDAYIATGSNNSSRYFDYYFGKYPNMIRRNRTSIGIITGDETPEELELLADDVCTYFGLGCRNITKIYAPAGYDFIPLLSALKKYSWLSDYHKYKNNYDYNLAILLLNKNFYMTNGTILLTESPNLFSPISQLNYEFYVNKNELVDSLKTSRELQCISGQGFIPFGKAQSPGLRDYADAEDTLEFLIHI